MKFSSRWRGYRCLLYTLFFSSFLCLVMVVLMLFPKDETKPIHWHVNAAHKQLVHEYARRVLQGQCRPSGTRLSLLSHSSSSKEEFQPFLWRDEPLTDDLFLYPPPFGFKGLKANVKELLQLLPTPSSHPRPVKVGDKCHRCVVVGNGGILKGLKLGPLIDSFDTVIRLNNAPLGVYSSDVGNRTTLRVSYPEGTPLHWVDTDPHTVFVAVVYKKVDLNWISAMINNGSVPLWDWIFFWQKVPEKIPIGPSRFRLLNPHIIRETALDFLKFPLPRQRLWGWDQNVPTLGLSVLSLASLLCDEVSLAGFGYNLSHKEVPLHYYDNLPMSSMQYQRMHNVDRETQFLHGLVKKGIVTDLTGGIHCSFCPN